MLYVISYGYKLSIKARFIVELFKAQSNEQIYFVTRKLDLQLQEKWHKNNIELATSNIGIFIHFLLILLDPQDLRDRVIQRLTHRYRSHELWMKKGFLSILSFVLHFYYAYSKTETLEHFLNQNKSPKIFLIDEYKSINLVDLKMLKRMGSIVYISQDFAYNHFSFADSSLARNLMYQLEKDAVAKAKLVIACSERDKLKYKEMGAKKAVFYPNIYPIAKFEPDPKDPEPSVCIVLRSYWGPSVHDSLEEIFTALSYLNKSIKVYLIGVEPQKISKNVKLQHYQFIPSKADYLRTISKSWVGINVGIHLGGANERKYDYAMAGLLVISDRLGSRGDLLPVEYTYVDSHDLAAKLNQLLSLSLERIVEMGQQNRELALSLAEAQRSTLSAAVNDILIQSHSK
jgi:hypothetical protein